MSLLSGEADFFGLDIGTTAVRLVQLRAGGGNKTLVKYAYVPVDSKVVASDAKVDQQKLAQIIKELITQAQLTTKNVAVGLPSQKVFTTVVDVDRLPDSDMDHAIHYQADSLIPTPLNESKIDFAKIGDSPSDKTKVEMLLTSVTNSFIEEQLDLLEGIGLNVVAFEPDGIALARALVAPGSTAPQMVLDVGNHSTDLVIVMNDAPHLVRSISTGTEAIIRAAGQNLNIDNKQALQFVSKFGLNKDKLEGQVYQAIIGTVDVLVGEIEKSIKFFATRYPAVKLDRIVVTGGAATLPEFPLYIANKFSVNVEIGNAWRNVAFSADRQNELLAVSNQFAVAAGLAERAG